MKITKVIVLLLTVSMMFFMFGCGDETEEVNEFEVLVEYLEGDDGGYVNNLGTWIMTESSVNTDDYLILDLRSATDYAAMHIDGAVNVTLATMFDEAANTTKPILTTCYSGQTASFAHTLLRLKGYEAFTMKFGMSMHDASLDKWSSNTSDAYADDLVTTASAALPEFDYPELSTGFDTAEEILDARIDAAIAAWGDGLLILAGDVIGNTPDYNIMNYWSETDYLGHGHINGAYQLTPATLKMDGNLSAFDPAGSNIFYCYTGQTAAASIAYLTVIGYDVKSIKFGFNAMYWSELPGHKWGNCPNCGG
ncbi:MAG: rhodanese-like domain-containing protein [Candidatus Marinimicrobia bacterium]|nr:rhodanese-like domain-containing protein [Candidatus Neomarinimicrobiota bacterium]